MYNISINKELVNDIFVIKPSLFQLICDNFLITAVIVGWEKSVYTVPEALNPYYGLLVCVTVEDVMFPFSLITSTEDASAIGMTS